MRHRSRVRLGALCAAIAAPAAGRAQAPAGVPYGQYVGRGCGDGVLAAAAPPATAEIRGTLVCIVGTFTFTYLPSSAPGVPDQFRLVANTLQTVSPAFAGSSVNSNGGQLFGRYPGPTCPDGVCGGDVIASLPGFAALQPGANERTVTAFGLALPPTADLSRAAFDSVRFVYDYALPGAGPGFTSAVVVTFSAVPEPSTLSLAAVGAVALGARARRRRRSLPTT